MTWKIKYSKQHKKWYLFIIGIVLFVLITLLVYQHYSLPITIPDSVASLSPTSDHSYQIQPFSSKPIPTSWRSINSKPIGIDFKIPQNWKVKELTAKNDIKTLKIIELTSPEFRYSQTEMDTAEQGIRINIELDASVEYESFDQFVKGKAVGHGWADVVNINNHKWLYSNSYALTLYNQKVITITFLSKDLDEGIQIFKQILSSISFDNSTTR